VNDAVRRAGGPTGAADLTQVNLAAELQDGRQVLLPARTTGQGGAGGAAGSPSAPGVPLNLNTATAEQLDELDGIGPATAKQIVDVRTAKGGFGSVDELAEVPGIGDKRLATLREQVRV
jgi:competence protein ComEA